MLISDLQRLSRRDWEEVICSLEKPTDSNTHIDRNTDKRQTHQPHLVSQLASQPTSFFHLSRGRADVEPANSQFKRVGPAVIPRYIQIQPPPLAILEIYRRQQQSSGFDLPQGTGEDGSSGGDNTGAAATDEFFSG